MRKIALFVSMMAMALCGNAQSWTQQTSGVTTSLRDVFFVNDSVGWISTTGAVLKTTNGGNNWSSNTTGINVATDLKSIFFVSENIGWAVGTGGVILNTTDGGQSWTSQSSGTTKELSSIYFVSDTVGWIVVTAGTNPQTDPASILKTRNGGATWTVAYTYPSTYNSPLNTLFFINENLGWAVGGGSVTKLTNSGNNVTRFDFATNTNFRDVYFTDAANGWVVGDNGKIYVSSDSGTTWTSQTSGVTSNLFGVHFTSQTDGWAVGQGIVNVGPTLRRTTNGGLNWTTFSLNIGAGIGMVDVLFLPSGKGWMVGGSRIYTYNSNPSAVELSASNKITIYPNPSINLLNVEMQEIGTYRIMVFDALGRNIFSMNTNERQVQIGTASWTSGHYHLNIMNEKGQMNSKTVVKE